DDVGSHPLKVDPLSNRAPCNYRSEPRGTEFNSLLHHIVEPRALQWRKNIVEIGPTLLRTDLFVHDQVASTLASAADSRTPFPVAAVEDEKFILILEPQYVDEVVHLLIGAGNGRARSERRIDRDTLCIENVYCRVRVIPET